MRAWLSEMRLSPAVPGARSPCGHRAATPISRGCQPRCSGSRAAVCTSGEDCGRGPWGGRRAPEGSEAQAIWNVRSHLGAARIHCNAPGPATPRRPPDTAVQHLAELPVLGTMAAGVGRSVQRTVINYPLHLESLKRLPVFSEQEAILFALC